MGGLKGMYEDDDDQIFYLPSGFGNLMDLPDYTAHVRYDEYTAIGSPKIETPEDYFNTVMEILEKYPTTPNGESRYSLTLYNWGFPETMSGYWGLIRGFKADEDNNLTYWTETEEGKAMAKYFNEWWRTGTMDPEAFTNLWDDARTKISQARVVGLIGGWWIGYNAGHEIWSLTDPNWTEDKRFIQVTFKAPEAENAYLTVKNNLGSTWTIITDKCKDPEGVMKYIDFILSDEGAALVNWGMPGEIQSYKDPAVTKAMWHINGVGDWEFDATTKQQFIDEVWDYNDEGIFGSNTGIFALSANYDRWDDGVHCVWGNQMWYSENKWKGIMFENSKGTIFDKTAFMAQMMPMSADDTMAYQAITDAYRQYYPLACMAGSDEEFEAAWETLQNAVRDADLATYVNYRTENYKRNLSKMGE
jgi:ABC-type glycerol-3-phosphate transport system substrate-binding protein